MTKKALSALWLFAGAALWKNSAAKATLALSGLRRLLCLEESIPLLVEIPKRGPMAVTRRSLAFLASVPSLAVRQSEGGADAGTP